MPSHNPKIFSYRLTKTSCPRGHLEINGLCRGSGSEVVLCVTEKQERVS